MILRFVTEKIGHDSSAREAARSCFYDKKKKSKRSPRPPLPPSSPPWTKTRNNIHNKKQNKKLNITQIRYKQLPASSNCRRFRQSVATDTNDALTQRPQSCKQQSSASPHTTLWEARCKVIPPCVPHLHKAPRHARRYCFSSTVYLKRCRRSHGGVGFPV